MRSEGTLHPPESKDAAPTLILGVDPGFSGAVAVVDPEAGAAKDSIEILSVFDMPTYEHGGKTHLDLYTLAMKVDAYAPRIRFCVVEEPHAMPGQGVSSMFRFGHACGAVAGVLAAFYLPIHFTRPQVWKRMMNLSHDKELSRRQASETFPGASYLWSRKKDDGRAEAALLAVFGIKYLKG